MTQFNPQETQSLMALLSAEVSLQSHQSKDLADDMRQRAKFHPQHRRALPQPGLPQRLAVVELDEGIRMTTTLVNIADGDIRIGMRVKPYFEPATDEITLLRYQPA
jgi:hypothetical protein